MPKFLPQERVEKARELYQGTALSHAEVGAEAGMGASTVSVLAKKHGWKRHPGRRASPRIAAERRAAIQRLCDEGAAPGTIAAAVGCHRNTVRRVAPQLRFAGGAGLQPAGSAAAAELPEHLAELHAELTHPNLRKSEATRLLMRCATALAAEALIRPDPRIDRNGQTLARLADRISAMPDDSRPTGADDGGPASFEEMNELLAELAIRFGSSDRAGGAEAAEAAQDRTA